MHYYRTPYHIPRYKDSKEARILRNGILDALTDYGEQEMSQEQLSRILRIVQNANPASKEMGQ